MNYVNLSKLVHCDVLEDTRIRFRMAEEKNYLGKSVLRWREAQQIAFCIRNKF